MDVQLTQQGFHHQSRMIRSGDRAGNTHRDALLQLITSSPEFNEPDVKPSFSALAGHCWSADLLRSTGARC
ncbi:hypothetical protein KR52_03055 [Synechococcus sp. KORDI-52]|nr:hypothetical protein KR52_03055 [Synechococcus sp. KORDI-52]